MMEPSGKFCRRPILGFQPSLLKWSFVIGGCQIEIIYIYVLQSSKENSTFKNHCPEALTLFPQWSVLLLEQHQAKGSMGMSPSLPTTVSRVSRGRAVSGRPRPRGDWKGRVSWCTPLRAARPHHRMTALPSDLSTSFRNAERSGSAQRSRRENEPVLGLVLKTELEQEFYFLVP